MLATIFFASYKPACALCSVLQVTIKVLACIALILAAMFIAYIVVTAIVSAFVLYVLPVLIVVGKLSVVGGCIKCFLSFAAI
jgi:hypothetical protein